MITSSSMSIRHIDSLTKHQIDTLTGLFKELWWTPDRSRDQVERMLQHSLVVAIENDQQQLIAFARVLSDRVFKALIFDVVVTAVHRGTGLGRVLMDAIVHHSCLTEVRHFELYCAPEMKPLYQKWGFSDSLGELTFMRLDQS
ncbi:MAG: GNAT family N-acetyltransferase [Kofleriaceae bacterium]|nr:GNAT family N-acetyltransferase [Kofleriaceae bacterium]